MSSNAPTHIATSGKNVPDQDTLERLETLGYIESFSVHFLEQELSQIESLLRREEDLFAEIDRKRHDRDTLIQKAERATIQSLAEKDMGKAIEIRRIIEKLNERNAKTLPEYIEVQGIIEILTLKRLKLEQFRKGKNIRGVYYRVTQLGALYAQGKEFNYLKDKGALNYLGYTDSFEAMIHVATTVEETISNPHTTEYYGVD